MEDMLKIVENLKTYVSIELVKIDEDPLEKDNTYS